MRILRRRRLVVKGLLVAGVVLASHAELQLPAAEVVGDIAVQGILLLDLVLHIFVGAYDLGIVRICVIEPIAVVEFNAVVLREGADQPVQVAVASGPQANLLTVDTVVSVLEQQVDRYRLLGEVGDAPIVGKELGRDRRERHLVVQLLIDLQRRREYLAEERRTEIVVDRVLVLIGGIRRGESRIFGHAVQQVLVLRTVVVAIEGQPNFGRRLRFIDERETCATVVALAVRRIVVGVVDVAIVVIVVGAQAHAELVGDRPRQHRGEIPGAVLAELDGALILPGRGRILGHILDRAADVGATVQRALRALQDLDARNVVGPYGLTFEQLHVVRVKPNALHHFERAHTAYRHGRRVVVRLEQVEVRDHPADVIELRDVRFLDDRIGNGGNRSRDVEQILTALACGDDDFLERDRTPGSCRHCRGLRRHRRRGTEDDRRAYRESSHARSYPKSAARPRCNGLTWRIAHIAPSSDPCVVRQRVPAVVYIFIHPAAHVCTTIARATYPDRLSDPIVAAFPASDARAGSAAGTPSAAEKSASGPRSSRRLSSAMSRSFSHPAMAIAAMPLPM